MQEIVLASGNQGKLKELQPLLAERGYQVLAQDAFAVPEAEETGLTFVENAIIKARNACLHSGLPAIADDSGLEVDALHGEPGIYSARYSGAHGDDASNNAKLLRELRDVPAAERSARYQCVLVYLRHANDPTPIICQAAWEGSILTEPAGDGGFGYDPIFYLSEQNCSAAQLDKAQKSEMSHRGRALAQLISRLPPAA